MAEHRILTLIRHAKAGFGEPGSRDIDRPLDKRGLRDAQRMAKWLAQETQPPDLILSSPAKRARTTAEAMAQAFGIATADIRIEDWIYYRGPKDWIEGIQSLDDDLSSVLLVGHNPTISELGTWLLGRSYLGFATCTICSLQLPVTSWALTGTGPAKQLLYQSPSDLT